MSGMKSDYKCSTSSAQKERIDRDGIGIDESIQLLDTSTSRQP